MTIEQKVTKKFAEVAERRRAIEAGIRLEIVEKLAIGILDLLDETISINHKQYIVETLDITSVMNLTRTCVRLGELSQPLTKKIHVFCEDKTKYNG